MSLKLNERYPGRFNNPSADYPGGSFKNRTTPGAKDGSYLEKDWANDKEGFFQSIVAAMGVAPNGLVDKVGASQFFDCLLQLTQNQIAQAFPTAGTATALTLTPVPAIPAYAANQRFSVKFHVASGTSPTLNASAKGAKALKQYDASGAKVAAVFAANQVSDIFYDGTDFVLLDQLPVNGLVVGSGGWLGAPGIVTGSVSAITSSQLVSMTTPNTTDRPPNTQNSSGLHMIFAGGAYSADIAVGHNDTTGVLQFRSSGGLGGGWHAAWHDGNFTPSSKLTAFFSLDAGFVGGAKTAPYIKHTDGTVVALQVDRPKDTATFGASGSSTNADTGEIIQWMEVLVGDIPAGGTLKNITWPFAFPNAFVNAWTSIRVTSGTPQISNCYYSLGTVNGCRLQIDEGSQQVQPADLTVIVFARGR